MQDQKSSLRTERRDVMIFISICLIVVFLSSIFFNHDIKHLLGITDGEFFGGSFLVDCLPILAGVVCAIFLFIGLSKNISQKRTTKTYLRNLIIILLIAVLVLGVVFNKQILIARELIEFKLHQQAFDQLIGTGQKALKFTTGCGGGAELPPAIRDALGHHMMDFGIDWQGTTWMLLFQDKGERESDFFYVDGKLPTLGSMTGACGALIECYYQINDHWFLCNEYSKDI